MNLPIDRIRLFYGRMPVDLEFSYGRVESVTYCLAQVFSGDCVGLGEGVHPRLEDCESLARTLLGEDALRLDQLLPPIDFTWQESVPREMLSMALHDLVARRLGVPLYVLMGGLRRERVPVMPCLFPKSPEHAAETAQAFTRQGYAALKVKIFGKPDLDAAIIEAVRAVFPIGYLQAGANCGYQTLAETQAVLPRLYDAGLDMIEDPGALALEDYAALRRLSSRPRTMLDAPTRGDSAIGRVARLRAADAVNLHANMQGTFSEIRDRAAAARLAGMDLEVGGTGYTGVGAFAHLHVAAALGESYPYGEIGGWLDHGMPASTAAAPLPISDGCIRVPPTPGHGGELDEAYLAANAEMVELTP